MIYYTSDLHLGNSNIIKYEHRPWKTVEEMDEGLIDNWNAVVTNEDHVYVLGDFCFKGASRALEYLGRLRGQIHLIRGNHDHFMKQQDFMLHVQFAGCTFNEGWYKHMRDGEHEVVLCHYPILHWDGEREHERNSIHLYGHVHSRPEEQHPSHRAFNVGVDVNNYRPVTLEQLLKKGK